VPEPRYSYDNYLYDLEQNLPESHKIAREKLIKSKMKSKEGYDKNENAIQIHVSDDLVLLKNNASKNKLNSLWTGPFEIIEVLGEENIVIQRGRRGVTVHENNVKKYYNDKLE
jgi:hypothetical protein